MLADGGGSGYGYGGRMADERGDSEVYRPGAWLCGRGPGRLKK